jgi:O-antigen ligase
MLGDLLTNISKRSIGTFLNPNMASSYLGLSFFLLLQPYARMSKLLTNLFGFIMLGGILATKSLAGLIGFFFVITVMMILYWYRSRNFNIIKLLTTILIIVLVSLVIYSKIAKIPNLSDRFQRSSYARINILKTGLDTFIKNPLGFGIGPAGFREVGPKIELTNNRVINMELHSDWLSFLVERGIFGFLGLVLLFWAIGKMLFEITKHVNSQQEVLWAIGLCGMFIFTLSFSLTHEVLHFRHIWCAFALIAVEYKFRVQNHKENQKEEAL